MKHRKITAIVLVLALLLALLPASALAVEGSGWNDNCRGNPGGKHNWVKQSEMPGKNCTSKGMALYYCSYCGASAMRETKAPGHKWGKWKTTREATCAKAGEETRKCKVCGKKDTRVTDKKAHTWGEWTVTAEPTDFTMGTRTHTCQVCGTEKAEDFYPDPTYKRGDRGEGVKDLQGKLNAAGYDCGKADGQFGKKTEAAVKVLEAAHGVEADGIAWPGVQKWLGMIGASSDTTLETAFVATLGLPGESAADLLNSLRDLTNGFDDDMPEDDSDLLRIVRQPEGGVIRRNREGESFTLSVEVTGGEPPYTYEWHHKNATSVDLASNAFGIYISSTGKVLEKRRIRPDFHAMADSDTPTLPVNLKGTYYCVISDDGGDEIQSVEAEVNFGLFIAHQPENARLWEGPAELKCVPAGGVPFAAGDPYLVTWYHADGTPVPGGVGMVCPVSDEGEYYCTVADTAGGEPLVSNTATVYAAPPIEIAMTPSQNLTYDPVVPSSNVPVFASVSGGVAPYAATWTFTGEKYGELTGDIVDLGASEAQVKNDGSARFDIPWAGYGRYAVTVTDAMGETAQAYTDLFIEQLYITRQPRGGMLPYDHSPIYLTTSANHGVKPFKYTLYRKGEVIKSDYENEFAVTEPGVYYIHVEDVNGAWADTDRVKVWEYDFRIVDYSPDIQIVEGPPYEYLSVTTEGGEKPITYEWEWYSLRGDEQEKYKPSDNWTCCAWRTGYYYCRATDKNGTEDYVGPITVTWGGERPLILKQPVGATVEYEDGYPFDYTLSCDATCASGDQYLRYEWFYKDPSSESDRWVSLGYGKVLPVNLTGNYFRCEVTDMVTGGTTVSDEVCVCTRLKCTRAEQVGKEKEIIFEFVGGIPPYKVRMYRMRYTHVTSANTWIYVEDYHFGIGYAFGGKGYHDRIKTLYSPIAKLNFDVRYGVKTHRTEGNEYFPFDCPYTYYMEVEDSSGQYAEGSIPMRYEPTEGAVVMRP